MVRSFSVARALQQGRGEQTTPLFAPTLGLTSIGSRPRKQNNRLGNESVWNESVESTQARMSTIDWHPEDPATLADPYDVFTRLRNEDPCHWSPRLKSWVLTRYDDVKAVCLDKERLSSDRLRPFFASLPPPEAERIGQIIRYLSQWMVFKDPPDHTRLRRLTSRVFHAKSMQAMRPQAGGAPVLLIDELDRTDEPFEAFLLEALSDFQVTIPELGTIVAPEPPIVILTSNRTREVHDALKRRCLYHWVDYPSFPRELEILQARAPEASARLSAEVVAFVQRLRGEDLFKKPGVAETIDWAKCLLALDVIALSPEVIADTLGAILKYQDDIQKIQGSEAKRLLDEVRQTMTVA